MMERSYPDSPYWAQWTPKLTNLEQYQGTVLEVRMADMQIGSQRIEDQSLFRSGLRDGEPILITFIAGPASDAVAPILNIADEEEKGHPFDRCARGGIW